MTEEIKRYMHWGEKNMWERLRDEYGYGEDWYQELNREFPNKQGKQDRLRELRIQLALVEGDVATETEEAQEDVVRKISLRIPDDYDPVKGMNISGTDIPILIPEDALPGDRIEILSDGTFVRYLRKVKRTQEEPREEVEQEVEESPFLSAPEALVEVSWRFKKKHKHHNWRLRQMAFIQIGVEAKDGDITEVKRRLVTTFEGVGDQVTKILRDPNKRVKPPPMDEDGEEKKAQQEGLLKPFLEEQEPTEPDFLPSELTPAENLGVVNLDEEVPENEEDTRPTPVREVIELDEEDFQDLNGEEIEPEAVEEIQLDEEQSDRPDDTLHDEGEVGEPETIDVPDLGELFKEIWGKYGFYIVLLVLLAVFLMCCGVASIILFL